MKGPALGGATVIAAAATATAGHTPNGWRVFWLVFAAIGLTAEGIALWRKAKDDTASETVWWLRGPITGWRAFGVLAIMVWLTFHFAFGWWS